MNLIFFGAPGAGKGTQAIFIAKKFNLYQLSTGDILRNEIKNKTEIGKKIEQIINEGGFVTDSIINDLLKKIITNPSYRNRIIFDGYPRNVQQAENLELMLNADNQSINFIFFLKVNREILEKRILGRIICEKCNKTFNEYLKQTVLANNNIIFGLPYMVTNQYDAREMFHNITYPPSHIQHRMLHKRAVYLNQYIEQNKYAVFSIRSSIKTDIYFLYCVLKDDTLYKYGICHIPDFNTSKMMNNLFRDIKENKNLDALEESDTEEEFEDINPARYVYLDRVFKMMCVYNKKFNRWKPIKINNDGDVTKQKKIIQMEKK